MLPAICKDALEIDMDGFVTVKAQQSTQTCKAPECYGYSKVAEVLSEPSVINLTNKHIVNHHLAYFAAYGTTFDVKLPVSNKMVLYLSQLHELWPHDFASIFAAAKNKNPDILQ